MNKTLDCTILFSYRKQEMVAMISKKCLCYLKNANYISFIMNPERLIFGIVVPADPKIGIKVSSLRTRGDYYYVQSDMFGKWLMHNLHLDKNKEYQVFGHYFEESNCILFPLREVSAIFSLDKG